MISILFFLAKKKKKPLTFTLATAFIVCYCIYRYMSILFML